MLEHKISWKVLKIFAQECSYDDLGIYSAKFKFTFWDFIWEEFLELVEDFGAKVNTDK